MPESVPINRTRLLTARKRRGLTITELAEKMELDVRTISSYESGQKSPSPAALVRLARVLGFPLEFFEGNDIEAIDPAGVSFRSMSRMSARLRDTALGQGALAIEFLDWLERRFELPEPRLVDLRYDAEAPEGAADSLRRLWGIGELPIRNMVHLLEANGIRVFSLSIDAREMDAFSLWRGNTPIVMLNSFKSAEHSRFDSAHELAHLVLHRHLAPGSKIAEAQADAFASAFLMPRASVLANCPAFITVDQLIQLKAIWGVSVSALNYRLHKIGRTSDWQYKALCIEISKRGYRTCEPNEMPRESSIVLPKLLASLHKDDGLTRSAIAAALKLPPGELNDLLFGLTVSAIDGNRKGEPSPFGRKADLRLVK